MNRGGAISVIGCIRHSKVSYSSSKSRKNSNSFLPAPLFIFQWLFDEAQMEIDQVGVPVTMEQWDYIHEMGKNFRKSFQNVSAIFAPSCISHTVLTKRDWLSVKIGDISLADSLFCWEHQHFNRRRRKNSGSMVADEPSLVRRQLKKNSGNNHNKNNAGNDSKNKNKNRKKKRNRQRNGKNKKRKGWYCGVRKEAQKASMALCFRLSS